MADDMAARFERDTAGHQMTILHDDGLYRHLRFRRPDRSAYWFDLITWPGSLVVNGDCGSFTLARCDDMFEFFRGHGINPQYWAEKVRAGKTTRYSPAKFRQLVTEYAADAEADEPGLTAAIAERIFGALKEWDTGYEEGAREALRDFEYRPEGDGSGSEPFRFTDAWEWDLHDYDWQFLWCCHAIQWGIGQYDKQKVPVSG